MVPERPPVAAAPASPCPDPRLAELCHRVRTPLHGVLGSLELLLDSDLTEDAAELARSAFVAAADLHRAFEGYVEEVLAAEAVAGDAPVGPGGAGQGAVADAVRVGASPSMR